MMTQDYDHLLCQVTCLQKKVCFPNGIGFCSECQKEQTDCRRCPKRFCGLLNVRHVIGVYLGKEDFRGKGD